MLMLVVSARAGLVRDADVDRAVEHGKLPSRSTRQGIFVADAVPVQRELDAHDDEEIAVTSSTRPAIIDLIGDLLADRRRFKQILPHYRISRGLRQLSICSSLLTKIVRVVHLTSSPPGPDDPFFNTRPSLPPARDLRRRAGRRWGHASLMRPQAAPGEFVRELGRYAKARTSNLSGRCGTLSRWC